MAAEVRRMLNSLSSSAGSSHKDATGKYREILEKTLKFKEPDVTEGLKALVEGGKLSILYLLKFYVNWTDPLWSLSVSRSPYSRI